MTSGGFPDLFVEGFLREFPEGADHLSDISIDGFTYRFRGWRTGPITIGNSERTHQREEGETVARIVRATLDGTADSVADAFGMEIEINLHAQGLPLHSQRVVALHMTAAGEVVPSFNIETSEIDDALISRVMTFCVGHDDIPIGRREGPWVGRLAAIADWGTTQRMLHARREDCGILMDPVLHKAIGRTASLDLMELLRRMPRPPGAASDGTWTREQLANQGVILSEAVRAVRIKEGLIHSTIKLCHDVEWSSGRAAVAARKIGSSHQIRLSRDIPESIIMGIAGKRVSRVIEHPWIGRDWIVDDCLDERRSPINRGLVLKVSHCPFVSADEFSEGIG